MTAGCGRSAAPGVLGLAVNTAGGIGPRFEPTLRDLIPAVDASPVRIVIDAGERSEHLGSLATGRVKDRLRAIGLGQSGTSIGRVVRIPLASQGPGVLALQDRYRPVEVVAHLLKALAGDGNLH
jgi:hypothetical protein